MEAVAAGFVEEGGGQGELTGRERLKPNEGIWGRISAYSVEPSTSWMDCRADELEGGAA